MTTAGSYLHVCPTHTNQSVSKPKEREVPKVWAQTLLQQLQSYYILKLFSVCLGLQGCDFAFQNRLWLPRRVAGNGFGKSFSMPQDGRTVVILPFEIASGHLGWPDCRTCTL